MLENRLVVAIHAPAFQPTWSDRPRTFDWRYPKGSPENDTSIGGSCDVMPIEKSLLTQWNTDAYALQYLLRHEATGRWVGKGLRIAADALDWLESQGFGVYVHTILTDVDNPRHEDWTVDNYEAFCELIAKNPPSLRRSCIYVTGRGWRAVQPLTRPVPVREYKKLVWARISLLWRDGIACDENCNDWQHLFRMPRTRRDDGRRSDTIPQTLNMVAVDPDEIIAEAERHKPTRDPSRSTLARAERAVREKGKERRAPPPVSFVTDLPPWWLARAKIVAEAIRETPPGIFTRHSYHALYLAIAGALCYASVSPELIPAIVRAIAVEAKSIKPEAHRQSAHFTVARYATGADVTGRGKLAVKWPDVGRAFAKAMLLGRTAETREARAALPDIDTARAELKLRLEYAARGAGPVLVKAPPGTGKTTAAYEVAIKNLPQADGSDGGSGIRTAISFDKNRLAVQTMNYLTHRNIPTRRYRSPLSVINSDGTPACALHDRAVALQRGGYSVTREFCHGGGNPHGGQTKHTACSYGPLGDESCVAYGTWEQPLGAGTPGIALSNHALVIRGHEYLEEKGWLVIDEPPSILQTIAISLEEIERALGMRDCFDSHRVDPVVPALLALRAWARVKIEDETDSVDRVTIGDAVSDGCGRLADDIEMSRSIATARTTLDLPAEDHPVCLGDVLELIHVGFPPPEPLIDKQTGQERPRKVEPRRVHPPALRRASRTRAMHDSAFASRLGSSASTFRVVAEAMERHGDPWLEATVIVRDVPDREGSDKPLRGTVIYVTMPNRDLITVLRRPGPTALLDANAELHQPLIRRLFEWEPDELDYRTIRATAREAAMVERVWWKLASANRKAWFVHGRPIWSSGIVSALKKSIQWACHVPRWSDDVLEAPLCLITYHPIELGIRFVLSSRDGSSPRKHPMFPAWQRMGLDEKDADEAVRSLEDVVCTWKGAWILGHYGAVRGMDDADSARTYVSLGTPWPALDDVLAESSWLGVDPMDRWRERCRSELEQVFGRSRSACRVIFMRMLCVGNVSPSGEFWNDQDVTVCEGREPVSPSDSPVSSMIEMREEMGLTQDELARKIGISGKTLRGYEKGLCHVPQAVLSDIIAKYGENK